ncbi:hypothetical protein AG1IA_10117 [Rhizoctonia solani AG-1 IA]|uniref:Uncharacterized protein n=1 Tax=Thanatephorus cucumeris (strain AG1-IA) TaxID=983506 RepID=L8WGL5_THACA|nr:hypothetical protein AG1IA_10117 [Rhizoctonia solani AG-1 IA]
MPFLSSPHHARGSADWSASRPAPRPTPATCSASTPRSTPTPLPAGCDFAKHNPSPFLSMMSTIYSIRICRRHISAHTLLSTDQPLKL